MSETPQPVPRRDGALDLVKGLLVVGMVLIHAANLFIDSAHLRYQVYPVALGFVSGSWVFISGYLVSAHYQSSFDANMAATARRLWGRGLRLLLIFLVVNFALGKISLACPDGPFAATCQPWRLLVIGDNKGTTFEILQGIAYVLLVAPLYMALPRAATVAIVLLLGATTALQLAGESAHGLPWMILVGLVGTALGWYVPADWLLDRARTAGGRAGLVAAGLAAWGVNQAVTFLPPLPERIVGSYVAGVAGMLAVLYGVSAAVAWPGPVERALNLMARYALPAYMGQMALLLAWRQAAGILPVLGHYAVAVVAGTALLVACLALFDHLRRRSRLVDGAYRLVFG